MVDTKKPHAMKTDAKEQHSVKNGATFYETGKRIARNVMDMQIASDGMTIGELIRLYRAGELVRVVRCGQCERGVIETEGAIAGYVQCDWCGFGALHPQKWYCGDGVMRERTQSEQDGAELLQAERGGVELLQAEQRNADATPPVNVARMIWDAKNNPPQV